MLELAFAIFLIIVGWQAMIIAVYWLGVFVKETFKYLKDGYPESHRNHHRF